MKTAIEESYFQCAKARFFHEIENAEKVQYINMSLWDKARLFDDASKLYMLAHDYVLTEHQKLTICEVDRRLTTLIQRSF